MNRRVVLASVALTIGPAVGFAAGGKSTPQPDRQLVEKVDQAFQARYQSITTSHAREGDKPKSPEHEVFARMSLQNDAERGASAELRSHDWQVLLFAAGRRAVALGNALSSARKRMGVSLNRQEDLRLTGMERAADRVIGPPIVITGGRVPLSAPRPRTLLPAVLDAARVTRSKGTFEFRSGPWYVVARADRAGKQECLACHAQAIDGKRAAIGDPVGLALYAFTP